MVRSWQGWKYKNLTLSLFGIIFALLLSRIEALQVFLMHLGTFGYFGAFLGGILFVSTFTVAVGALILLVLSQTLSPLEIGFIAGLGAVFGDFTIYNLIKNNLSSELTTAYNHIDGKHHFQKILHTKYFSWSLPVIGALIIASPLPDEIGVTLMGISKMKTYKFLAISFILNAIGIFLIITLSQL